MTDKPFYCAWNKIYPDNSCMVQCDACKMHEAGWHKIGEAKEQPQFQEKFYCEPFDLASADHTKCQNQCPECLVYQQKIRDLEHAQSVLCETVVIAANKLDRLENSSPAEAISEKFKENHGQEALRWYNKYKELKQQVDGYEIRIKSLYNQCELRDQEIEQLHQQLAQYKPKQ